VNDLPLDAKAAEMKIGGMIPGFVFNADTNRLDIIFSCENF
jgi:hypothetical protein